MSVDQRLVLALLAVWLLLIAPYPVSLDGWAVTLVLALLTLDVVLGMRTGWLAFARGGRLDEREAALRDRAFRLAFRLAALGIATMLVTGYLSAIVGFFVEHQPSPVGPPNPIGARGIAALLELLAIAPTAVIAWLQPRLVEQPASSRRLSWLPLLVVPFSALLWLLAVNALPPRSALAHRVPGGLSMADATCGDFTARRETGFGFGGAIRLQVAVCWNGHQAFAVGDTTLPAPASLPAEEYAGFRMDPGLTNCRPQSGDSDFGRITQGCTETIDQDGTMHYQVRGRVWPAAGGLGARDLRLELTVTRDGRIVNFG